MWREGVERKQKQSNVSACDKAKKKNITNQVWSGVLLFGSSLVPSSHPPSQQPPHHCTSHCTHTTTTHGTFTQHWRLHVTSLTCTWYICTSKPGALDEYTLDEYTSFYAAPLCSKAHIISRLLFKDPCNALHKHLPDASLNDHPWTPKGQQYFYLCVHSWRHVHPSIHSSPSLHTWLHCKQQCNNYDYAITTSNSAPTQPTIHSADL